MICAAVWLAAREWVVNLPASCRCCSASARHHQTAAHWRRRDLQHARAALARAASQLIHAGSGLMLKPHLSISTCSAVPRSYKGQQADITAHTQQSLQPLRTVPTERRCLSRSLPALGLMLCPRTRHQRLVIRNAGGPARGVAKSKTSKGKEVSLLFSTPIKRTVQSKPVLLHSAAKGHYCSCQPCPVLLLLLPLATTFVMLTCFCAG